MAQSAKPSALTRQADLGSAKVRASAARTTDFPWFEFVDLQPTRKVTKIDSRWLWSLHQWDPEAGLLYTDQPLHPGKRAAAGWLAGCYTHLRTVTSLLP